MKWPLLVTYARHECSLLDSFCGLMRKRVVLIYEVIEGTDCFDSGGLRRQT